MAALLGSMITTAPWPDRPTLLELEREARRHGTGIQAEQLGGCWELNTTWKRSGGPSTPGTDGFLRALNACLILTVTPASDHIQIENCIGLAGLQLSFQGLAQLKGQRPLLFFSFESVQVKLGNKILYKKEIKTVASQRQAFFALIHLDQNQRCLIARGRGGGLALWTQRSIEAL
jgi:hypothetical protein